MSMTTVSVLLPGYSADSEKFRLPDELSVHFDFLQESSLLPWQASLCQLLGWKDQCGDRLPSLQVQNYDSTLVHADPIHLRAGRDTATFLSSDMLGLDDDSADALIDALNAFVESDGLHFHKHRNDAWFISGLSAQSLRAYPTPFLANRRATAFLPDDTSTEWPKLMSELQMLLHTHPVNQRRQTAGLLPVNSLWFWGGATIPELPDSGTSISVYADDPYGRALCKAMGVGCRTLESFIPGSDTSWLIEGQKQDVVIVDTRLVGAQQTIESFHDEAERQSGHLSDDDHSNRLLASISDQWLAPLSIMVRRGKLQQLAVYTEDGVTGICSGQAPWWRRLLGRV